MLSKHWTIFKADDYPFGGKIIGQPWLFNIGGDISWVANFIISTQGRMQNLSPHRPKF